MNYTNPNLFLFLFAVAVILPKIIRQSRPIMIPKEQKGAVITITICSELVQKLKNKPKRLTICSNRITNHKSEFGLHPKVLHNISATRLLLI
jgi:hypothetical protein